MNNPCMSIILPIFNASKYLDESLGGLVKQSLRDMEIICVNDGSTDNSLEIMKRYASADSRIKIIDKPNGGYGHAMNCGLAIAKGEYIGILEPDDFGEKEQFKTLYTIAKTHDCDVVKANYYEYREKTGKNEFMEVLRDFPYNTVFSPKDNVDIIYMRPCIWSGIYRRQFLVDNHIKFNETPGASYQDTAFAFKVWVSAKRVLLVKDAFLHYRIDNENSSVNSTGKIFCICDEFSSMQSFLNLDQELKARFIRKLQVLKFDSYYWNLQRISEDLRDEFRDQMALEFIKADYEGFLHREDFDDWRWGELQKVLGDYRLALTEGEKEKQIEEYANSFSYKIGYALLQPFRMLGNWVKKKSAKLLIIPVLIAVVAFLYRIHKR